MKKWWFIVIGTLTYVIGIGTYFSNRIMYMKTKEDDFIRKREIEAKRLIVDDADSTTKNGNPPSFPCWLFVEMRIYGAT